jgi:hypothetical protein
MTEEQNISITSLEPVANANSKQLLTDFYSEPFISYSQNSIIPYPDFEPTTAFKIIQNDPIVKAALIKKVDKTVESGWRIIAKDGKSRKEELELKLSKLRFNRVLRKILFHAYLYNNAFIEIVKKHGEVTDLNVLDPASIEIVTEKNGDVKGYKQKNITSATDKVPSWTPEQIWHFKVNDVRNNVWAEFDIKSAYETILLKDKVRNWFYWFFATNQMKGVFNIKNASDKSIKDFLSYYKASSDNPNKPLILEGEMEYLLLRKFADDGKSMLDLMEWCDGQILSLFQVPPLAVGKMDQSGRSNASEAFSAMYSAIYSMQELFEEDCTFELFPKMGFDKNFFEFGIIDYVNEERVFKIVGMMKQAQFKDEIIAEWLSGQGLQFATMDIFNPLPDPMMGATGGPQVQSDNAPSRARKSEGDKSKSYVTPTTRQDQIVKNSWDGVVRPDDNWVI